MADVLIVDDEPNIRRLLASLLEAEGHTARASATGEDGLAAVADREPDVVLLDLALPGADGLEILETLRAAYPALPVVMMSGRATLTDAVRATKIGAFHFIEKPLSAEAVLLTVASAIELRRARELTRALTAELSAGARLVGSSRTMRRVRELIEQVAPTEARVLITGESGTGKEMAAAALHELSPRASGPFVRVNSAAIPRELVESEMFGHERGAFTGAHDTRRGRFELADGGTLFLDEIADLGMEAQAKLLRAIETGTIERIGGQAPIRVDVRVIAATNRSLESDLAAGRFREDLYYRLNVLRIHMPALRERLDDVPELIEHLMARLRQRHGLAPPVMTAAALDAMSRYEWPGNVRELANVCERLAILHPGREAGVRELTGVLSVDASARPASAQEESPLHERIDAFERELIERTLDSCGGSMADAARRLQTDRANLYRRMRRLGIER
ncbi:MAG: sigma-54-dependent Fis family transcriptional regulator [Gemmatimonadetes bacterium]|nr:sigma-54-dependent Fis family transcriptional regulator [Gemmatimonadota bacterium]